MGDLYDNLGVTATATEAEILAAGRRAQKEHHPDKGGDRIKFERVTRALAVLRDPQRRAEYDRTGDFSSISPEAQEQSEALALLSGELLAIMSNFQIDPTRVDIMKEIRERLSEMKRGAAVKRTNFQAGVKRIETYLARLKTKDESRPNHLREVLRGHLKAQLASLADLDRTERVIDLAAEHLENYGWEVDAQPQTWSQASSDYAWGRTTPRGLLDLL